MNTPSYEEMVAYLQSMDIAAFHHSIMEAGASQDEATHMVAAWQEVTNIALLLPDERSLARTAAVYLSYALARNQTLPRDQVDAIIRDGAAIMRLFWRHLTELAELFGIGREAA